MPATIDPLTPGVEAAERPRDQVPDGPIVMLNPLKLEPGGRGRSERTLWMVTRSHAG